MMKKMMWDIPELRPDRVATTIPTRVYGGGVMTDPATTLFIFRTASLTKARGMVVAFYVDDARLACLWDRPEHYSALFLQHGVLVAIEPDFSLWADMPLAEQLFNIFRMRTLGRLWQEHGLMVIPNLAWSDERSFEFCFSGIPQHAPVVACECRTPGGNDHDRRAFLRGLTESVKRTQPQSVLIYGGVEHSFWLTGNLPEGPVYHMLESFMTARSRIRAAQGRQVREKNQLTLFPGGTDTWADAEAVAA